MADKFMTAKQLGIMPAERKALIAFVEAKSAGPFMETKEGALHLYDQSEVDDDFRACEHSCGTAGCIAGFNFAHMTETQGVPRPRAATDAFEYIDNAGEASPFFQELYWEGNGKTVAQAQRVVRKALQTGKVRWR